MEKSIKRAWKVSSVLMILLITMGLLSTTAFASVSVTLSPTQDTYLEQHNPTKTFGARIFLEIDSHYGAKKGSNRRILVQFSLDSIPAGATILSATLRLYMFEAPATNRIYNAHRVTHAWLEGTGDGDVNNATYNGATWFERRYGDNAWNGNTPFSEDDPDWESEDGGGDFVGAETASASSGMASGEWLLWDITTDVVAWHAGSEPNYGTLIKDLAEDNVDRMKAQFDSKEGSLSPELVVNYLNRPPNAPSSLGPSSLVDGSWGNDNTPTLEFTQSDPDASDTVKYQVQIDDTFDFSSPVVDYISALMPQGSTSFTVGQAVGGGTYTAGSEGQTLSDGSYYWRVRSTDNNGATGSWATANPGNIAFKVDTTKPTVSITDPTASKTVSSASYTITGTANDPGSSGLAKVEVSIDNGSTWHDATGTSSWTYAATLVVGANVIKARSTDNAGNVSDETAGITLTYETDKPTVSSVTLDPPSPVKAGSVTFTIVFSKTMDTGTPPTVKFGKTSPYTDRTITQTSYSSNTWIGTFTIATGYDGEQHISISGAKDLAGNTMDTDTTHTFVVDTTPPTATVAIVADPVNIPADGSTASTITATVKDQSGNNVPDGTNVTFTTDHGTLGSSTVTKQTLAGVATASLTSELSTETVIATVIAKANGASNTTTVFFIPEGGAEVEEVESKDVSGTGGTIPSGESPTGGEVTVSGSSIPEDTTLTVAKYTSNPGGTPTFKATGDYWDTHLNDSTGVTSVTINFSPVDPGDTIHYWDGASWYPCSDQTHSDGCIVVIITDSTSPDLSNLSGLVFGEGYDPILGEIVINDDATFTNSRSVTLTLSANNAAQMQFSNDAFSWSDWEDYATEKSWTLTSGDGTKTVYVRFKDSAGNVSETYSDNIILDTTPPTATITFPSADTPVRGEVVIKGTASDENFLEYKVEYGQGTEPSSWTEITSSTSQVTDDTLATWDTSSLNDGSYTIRLTSMDLAGNSAQTQVSLRVDNHPPQATLIDYPNDTVTGNTPKVAVTFTWTGSDPDDITPTEDLVYQHKLVGHSDYSEWSDWTQEITKIYMLPSGNYTFKVRAKDEAGNYPEEDDPFTAKSSFMVSLPIIIYPNPCYPNQGQIVTIANLPTSEVRIYIYDLGGSLIRTLGESEANIEGGSKLAVWDCRNDNGEVVTRDIYIYFILSATEKKTGKIAIIR